MNVIVIVTDSLRADHVGCYGAPVRTPNIDALAADSALFEQAYSENVPTMPCRAAWWTGLHLFPHRGWRPFEHSDHLMAEMLWNRGFTSALISDTYHMHKPGYNCDRGFDTVKWIRGQEYDPWIVDPTIKVDISRNHRLRGDESDARWQRLFEQYLRNVSGRRTEEDYCVGRVFTEAIRWLEDATKKRKDNLFLWVDSFEPHEAWDPPSPYREMYDPDYTGQELIDPVPGPVQGYMTEEEVNHTKALYAGDVTFVDKWVGLLLDRIKELGLYENSLIMLTSDHGEPFGEHGIIRKARCCGYEELAHIPWIIHHPDGLGSGKRYDAFVQPPDMLPTVLEALGIRSSPERAMASGLHCLAEDPPADAPGFTGRSLIPILRSETGAIRDFAVTAQHGGRWTIRTGDWTCLVHRNSDKGPPELYNRQDDRYEQTDLFDRHPEVAADLERRLRAFAEEV